MKHSVLGEDITNSPEYLELLQKFNNLKEELDRYKAQSTPVLVEVAEHERDLVLQDYHELQQKLSMVEAQRDYAQLEANRYQSELQQEREKVKQLELFEASVLAICAVSHDQMAPYSKLALITSKKQVPYPAALHGGPADVMLTSMKQWNKAIGGNEDNTNCLNRALKPLEESNTVTRTEVNCNDGKQHYAVAINEQHLRHPRLISPDKQRPHNGGDKRCPQCNSFCKRNIKLTYECPTCGIDYDRDMNPLDHTKVPLTIVEKPTQESQPNNVIQFPHEVVLTQAELDVFAPTKRKRG